MRHIFPYQLTKKLIYKKQDYDCLVIILFLLLHFFLVLINIIFEGIFYYYSNILYVFTNFNLLLFYKTFKILFNQFSGHHHLVITSSTSKSEVHSNPEYLPSVSSTWMSFFHLYNLTYIEYHINNILLCYSNIIYNTLL